MGDKVEDVFLEVGTGATDAVDLVLTDHFGQRKAHFRGAHGSADGDKHLAARGQQGVVGFSGVHQCGGVEMTIMVLDKRSN